MPRLNESQYPGLAQFLVELKDEGQLPWESEKGPNVRDAVRADERFQGAIKEKGSIIPLRDLYRATKLASDGEVKSSGQTVSKINPKGRGGKERVWAARRSGMGLTLLGAATGLDQKALKAILAQAPDGDQMLQRSYGLNEDGSPKWSEGAAKIHAARIAAEADDSEEDDEVTETQEAPKPKRRRRPVKKTVVSADGEVSEEDAS
jgi:hypothetical protein